MLRRQTILLQVLHKNFSQGVELETTRREYALQEVRELLGSRFDAPAQKISPPPWVPQGIPENYLLSRLEDVLSKTNRSRDNRLRDAVSLLFCRLFKTIEDCF